MKKQVMKKLLPIIIALCLGAGIATADSTMGASNGHDLDALWATAQKTCEVSTEDAVVLLESRRIDVADDGAVATTVHRVVWIGTAIGIRSYADLRVPWNAATCALEVTKLRTWRDGRWWPDAEKLSETAIVHTLPYAVDHADDYTTMRETMLLHDGVELPCIMETEYTITERGLQGVDDVFVMPQRDPAVRVRLSVSAPIGVALHHRALNGAPAPDEETADGRHELIWNLEPAAALKLPVAARPAAVEPTVAWSTWTDWNALGRTWLGAFDAAAVASKAAADSLRVALRKASGDRARLEAGGRWLQQSVRTIAYDGRWWTLAPRPAERTWETAYGHVLDKAALWTALMRGEGYEVTPLFADLAGAPALAEVPGLIGRGRLLLRVVASGSSPMTGRIFYCDPADATVHGEAWLQGRSLVCLAANTTAEIRPPAASMFTFELALTPGDSTWTGTGFLATAGALSIHDMATGSSKGLTDHISTIAASIVEKASVPAATATTLASDHVEARFDLSVPFAKEDAGGATRLVIGRPKGGLLDQLSHEVRLEDAARTSPVLLPGPVLQTVSVRLRLGNRVPAHLPAARAVENAAGRFTVDVEQTDGWLVYRRALSVNAGVVDAAGWADLRALLLEEADASNGTLTVRPAP